MNFVHKLLIALYIYFFRWILVIFSLRMVKSLIEMNMAIQYKMRNDNGVGVEPIFATYS